MYGFRIVTYNIRRKNPRKVMPLGFSLLVWLRFLFFFFLQELSFHLSNSSFITSTCCPCADAAFIPEIV
ncbi:hypothetical protein CW304_09825 [Bacillus sp. UFRGS-B20]|nr:hypothetical protein CW304_09825 [Bacillus sp. UFRGS-B20]